MMTLEEIGAANLSLALHIQLVGDRGLRHAAGLPDFVQLLGRRHLPRLKFRGSEHHLAKLLLSVTTGNEPGYCGCNLAGLIFGHASRRLLPPGAREHADSPCETAGRLPWAGFAVGNR